MAVKETTSEQEFLAQIEKHKGILLKISKMYMDDVENQQDLFQEITYQAWKSFANFRGESLFSTWLYRIALNTAIIFLKSEKKRKLISANFNENISIAVENYNTEKEDNLNEMYCAINQLNNIDKALIFYYLENFSGKEIAVEMGISEVNVRVKMNRAKTKLKELLNQN